MSTLGLLETKKTAFVLPVNTQMLACVVLNCCSVLFSV